ncbi:serine/threonine-protein kinase [Herbinix hemicellulosilytica]|uniref:non-specific serine/threonine protein kinase n=1 Tax=Herbinix hemicellulosilytica TaxID=1564487 RepID=A0A0H5SGS3_HERHM|nr:Stk1 family PASTA domain-containing Ser/Thr kinase [Herbinix hemicellulosilytica]RBP56781.1 serine/threonine-protein kinase [Herbinix hemicellulosilytica]CRZ34659.1 hypothetical protein HHT355_1458 [Herbinix hemicellulosilytica]
MLKPGMYISDRYEIIDIVGSGGMADVYKAKDQRLNRFVAIKVLKPEYASDTSFVNKFIGEAQSAAGLSHPNIVNVYDVGNENGLHYIVMEFIEGITLKRFIERKGKLDIKEAVGIAIQIAQGMEAAHDNNIIHRDIKPQNIIISKDGKVKVTDFGIAKASNSNTITSNAMGSVHYLSPEQARGGYSDEKSDIYSLGVTLYEMLSGQVPFAGDNTVSVALSHLQQEPIPLRELDENIPVSLDKIVQKCMQKRPERRYHSASELIADLKRALTNPDGDFVQIPAFVANDSPTINISNDLGRIKNGVYSTDNLHNRKDDKAIDDDDDDLEAMDEKVDKIFSVITIVTIVIVTIAIFYIVARFILPRKEENPNTDPIVTETPTPEPTEELTPTPEPTQAIETYKVPNVKGLKYEDAKATIEAKDPTALVRSEEEYSTEEPGFVVRQYPNPDTDFPVGSEVILYVSVGPESFVIPYVYGLTKEQAEQKLAEVGLKVKFETMNSNEIQAGKVISTDPPKESVVKEGDTITVYISAGPEVKQAAVPDLIGKTVDEARTLLANAGLALGSVSEEPSERYPAGQIFYQDTTAGELVDQGTKINVSVSTGPESVETGPSTGHSGNVRYLGTLRISDINPLDYVGDNQAEVILELEQNGYSTEIYNEVMTVTDFPLELTVEGESESVGIVRMYIDGELFKLRGTDEAYVWYVNFNAVEE